MDEKALQSLPGAEIVLAGISDLRSGRESVAASAVESARTRLARAGVAVPAHRDDATGDRGDTPAAHRLYELLASEVGDGAHARHNAVLARVDSFARAAEIARAR